MDRLSLEVEHGGFNEVTLSSGSARLTETDKQYRKQFLDAVRHAVHCKHATSPQYLYLMSKTTVAYAYAQVYITMQMMFLHEEGLDKSVANAMTWQREWTEADRSILSLVDTVLTGCAAG